MKQKIILLGLVLVLVGVLSANFMVKAQTDATPTSTTSSSPLVGVKYKKISWVGEVTALDEATKSFTLKVQPGFWGKLLGAILQVRKTEKTYQVLVTDQTAIRYKSDKGVIQGGFENLAVGQKVLLVGKLALPSQNKIEAISILVLTPWKKMNQCDTDSDCAWCGRNCLKKDPQRYCVQVTPPEGYECKCINHQCQKVAPNRPLSCEEKCKLLGYQYGICRSWAVTLNTRMGCLDNEKNVGQSSDCGPKAPKPIVGVDYACCCGNGVPTTPTSTPTTSTSTSPTNPTSTGGKGPAITPPGLIKLSCVWCDKNCVPWSPHLRCTDTMAPVGYSCLVQNGACQKVKSGQTGETQ